MNLLGEPPHVAEERETVNKTLEVLKRAQKVLKRDPDLATVPRFDEDNIRQSKTSDTDSMSSNSLPAGNKKNDSSLFGEAFKK